MLLCVQKMNLAAQVKINFFNLTTALFSIQPCDFKVQYANTMRPNKRKILNVKCLTHKTFQEFSFRLLRSFGITSQKQKTYNIFCQKQTDWSVKGVPDRKLQRHQKTSISYTYLMSLIVSFTLNSHLRFFGCQSMTAACPSLPARARNLPLLEQSR